MALVTSDFHALLLQVDSSIKMKNLCLLFTLVCHVHSLPSVVVNATFGQIKGIETTASNNQTYFSFRGIPYALPPLGNLRFAKPVPHPNLEYPFDATKSKIFACMQSELYLLPGEEMSEDCLTLNIYVKDIVKNYGKTRKVLVWVHGGGFVLGSSLPYEAGSFVTENDIIVVSIQYRLGVLGFLSTENEASPGNYGLWDQVLAIKWVKDNIASFGGDPDDICIAGESAGGASVSILSLSSAAKGLFTKVYSISGTATSLFTKYTNAKSDVLRIARSLNCWAGDDNKEIEVYQWDTIVDCLRTRPASEIANKVFVNELRASLVPRVDKDFLPDSPLKLLHDDAYLKSIDYFKRSYLISVNNNEKSLIETLLRGIKISVLNQTDKTLEERNELWEDSLNSLIGDLVMSRLELAAPSNELSLHVADWYRTRFSELIAETEIITDLFFDVPTFDILEATVRNSESHIRLLYFNHYPRFMKGSVKGSIHGIDICYWFDQSIYYMGNFTQAEMEGDLDEDDFRLKRMYSSLITEFVTTGDPGRALRDEIPEGWPEYSTSGDHYLDFDLTPTIQTGLYREKRELWGSLVPRLRKNKLKINKSFNGQVSKFDGYILGLHYSITPSR
ncbi:hypothetical protein Btru_023657 [Bulinus truncatus]|nr:hypothetical protein Btru_023657 [Bulinus truncatus]